MSCLDDVLLLIDSAGIPIINIDGNGNESIVLQKFTEAVA
jgi:hypothetical protein